MVFLTLSTILLDLKILSQEKGWRDMCLNKSKMRCGERGREREREAVRI
jgi:hypothetical protein